MRSPPHPDRWTVFIIQNSHIDIGFTDRQEAIARAHRDFIAQAAAFAVSPAQADRPPEARFKFTCEGFWALEQYLHEAGPSDRRLLLEAFASGCLELTAFRFHLTELLDTGHLRDTLEPARRFARENGIPLECALSCDVNGISWAFIDALADAGVRFLATNINTHHGGHPLGGPFQPFWWESPSGRRLLVWNGIAYHMANRLGLMGDTVPDGRIGVPGVDAGCPDAEIEGLGRDVAVTDIRFAERKLFSLLGSLERAGHPRRFLPVLGSGVCTDNGPPGELYCHLVTEWNARHGDRVFLRTATLREFFAHLEANEAQIPVHHGDWPDWWTDGVAAAPRDTLLFRHAQRTKRLLERLDPGARIVSPPERAALSASLALYAEHTFAHSETFSGALLTQQIFARKSAAAAVADEAVGRAFDRVRSALGEGPCVPRRPFRYTVINPRDHPATAVAGLPLDWWESPTVQAGFVVRGPDDAIVPHQLERTARGWLAWIVVGLPPQGRMELTFDPGPRPEPDAHRDAASGAGLAYENPFYALAFDAGRGLVSFRDAASGLEFIEAGGGHGLGTPLWQHFPNGDRGAAGGFLMAPRRMPAASVHIGRLTGIRRSADGPVFTDWVLDYEIPGAHRCALHIRCHDRLPELALTARVHKVATSDPEQFFVAFPFAVEGGTWHLDRAGGAMRPGLDQLPGTCCDHYLVQDGAACCGPDAGLAWTTLDAPMVTLGRPRLWEYTTCIEPRGALLSCVANNKWECNFPVHIADHCEFRYVVSVPPGGRDPEVTLTAVRDATVPFVVLRH